MILAELLFLCNEVLVFSDKISFLERTLGVLSLNKSKSQLQHYIF